MPGHFQTTHVYQKVPIYRPSGRYVVQSHRLKTRRLWQECLQGPHRCLQGPPRCETRNAYKLARQALCAVERLGWAPVSESGF